MNTVKRLLYDCLYLQDEIIKTAIQRREELKGMIENFETFEPMDKDFLKNLRKSVKMSSKDWKVPKLPKDMEDEKWGEL